MHKERRQHSKKEEAKDKQSGKTNNAKERIQLDAGKGRTTWVGRTNNAQSPSIAQP